MPPISRRPSDLIRGLTQAARRGKSEPPRTFYAPEVYGREAIGNIARTLPPVERAYANVRFSILRPKLLSVMDLLLPDHGRILDIGCGFGLFAAYFGQTQPERRILGVDPKQGGHGYGKLLTKYGFELAKAEDVGASVISAQDRESFYTVNGFDVTVGTVRDFGGEENPFVSRPELGGTLHFWDGGKEPVGVKGYGQ